MKSFDLVVIGGGPGGYVAAIRAAQLGMSVALVEAEDLGGVCLNWGCIPTKALLKSAELIDKIKQADKYGITVNDYSFDLSKMVKRSRQVANNLNKGIGHLLKKNNIAVISGIAKLLGAGKLAITATADSSKASSELQAKHIIIATGATARAIPGLEPDGKYIWSARDAMTPKHLPKSLLVMGAGAIGMEFASFYNSLGVQVTVVEALNYVLHVEDEEISNYAAKAFTKRGIDIKVATKVLKIERHEGGLTVHLNGGDNPADAHQQLEVECLISAVGVVGNTQHLGLQNTSIECDNSFIKVDQWQATHEANVYAIGDVAGAPCLAHKASHEGMICVEKINGLEHVRPLNKALIPGCTYGSPQVASVGLTENKALAAGHTLKVGRFPLAASGMAAASGDTEGFIKTVFDADTGELLGAHLIGADVTELIQGFVVAKNMETTEQELMDTVFAHPSISEAMHESVLDAYSRAIHI
ncbi:MAG: dihydrolipoamide dehydrogenase [Candidatus Paceibacteria bacterium]|jgi:dihydrolipoamide dehydrogenase